MKKILIAVITLVILGCSKEQPYDTLHKYCPGGKLYDTSNRNYRANHPKQPGTPVVSSQEVGTDRLVAGDTIFWRRDGSPGNPWGLRIYRVRTIEKGDWRSCKARNNEYQLTKAGL